MMKKLFSLILTIGISLSLVACDGSSYVQVENTVKVSVTKDNVETKAFYYSGNDKTLEQLSEEKFAEGFDIVMIEDNGSLKINLNQNSGKNYSQEDAQRLLKIFQDRVANANTFGGETVKQIIEKFVE